MEAGQVWRQYIIGAVANILVASAGYSMGWTSPINAKLNDVEQSPLPAPVTSDEGAWIGSLLNIGAMIGPFIGGFLAAKIGRKWGLLAGSVPLLIGWILILVATNVGLIYAGRIFWGLAVGMIYTVSPMYCNEIATDEARGALGSALQSFVTVGFLLIYSVGPFVSYFVVGYLGIASLAVFCLFFYFMPETPTYHLIKNDRDAAAKCLATIRGRSHDGVQAELEKIEANVKASMSKTASIADVFKGSNFKAFYISCALVFFQQFSGINAVLFYMTDIFKASGSSLDSAIATIIVGIVQVIASGMTPFVVDRLGRRVLLLVSSCGTAIGLGLLGMYFLLVNQESPLAKNLGWLPIMSLVLFILTYCWGLGPLPWAIMSELFPIEVKAIAAPIATAFCWVLSFFITRYFSAVTEAVGMSVAFWIFGICCACAFFFTIFIVPETKGKSYDEIQAMLGNKSVTISEKA